MNDIVNAGLKVLQSASVEDKVEAAHQLYSKICKSKHIDSWNITLPDSPARPEFPKLVSPSDVPRRRLGSEKGRAALLHAIAHIELNAIDLAVDMLCRFGNSELLSPEDRHQFVLGWAKVAQDEARHFTMFQNHLMTIGYQYGDFPAHNGLWQAALSTKDNFAARLAIAPMVLEARGLDVTPGMIEKLRGHGDNKSCEILTIIYQEEIEHVALGSKWFHHICAKLGKNPEIYFQTLVRSYFKGKLKCPFNHLARTQADMPESYYTPLV